MKVSEMKTSQRLSSFASFVFLTFGVIAFILVSCTVPQIKSLAMMHLNGESVTANFGIFGGCYETGTESNCFKNKLGFIPIRRFLVILPPANVEDWAWFRRLTSSMVFNPIAAAFGGVALLMLLIGAFFDSFVFRTLSLFFLVFGLIMALCAFGCNLGTILRFRSRVRSLTAGAYSVHIGSAFWLAVAATIAYIFAVAFASHLCCANERRDREKREAAVREKYGTNSTSELHRSADQNSEYPAESHLTAERSAEVV